MVQISINNLSVHYQRIGEGRPLVLLHGWSCDWQIWQPVIQSLAADYQLILPDLPNFGSSAETPQVWSSQDYAQWLSGFIQKLKLDKYYLGGHSLGGKIAAQYATNSARTQPQPEKLVLIDSAGLPDLLPWPRRLQKKLLKAIPIPLKELVPTKLKYKFLKWTHTATDHFFADNHQKAILEKIVEENIAQSLPKIEVETLIIWGRHDLATPLEHGQEFNRLIPKSLMVVFDNSQHFPFIDEPDKFIEVIQAQL